MYSPHLRKRALQYLGPGPYVDRTLCTVLQVLSYSSCGPKVLLWKRRKLQGVGHGLQVKAEGQEW